MSSTGTALYKQLAQFPTYRAAQFQSSNVIRATTSALDYDGKVKRQNYKTFFVTPESVSSTISQDSPDVVASLVSPSGKYLAVLRESNDAAASGGKKRTVEIWSSSQLEACEDVTKIHGVFYSDEYLSSISFSPSERKIAYTAEENTIENSDDDPLAKYRFIPEFGEAYGSKKKPSIFLFSWASRGQDAPNPSVAPLTLADPPTNPVLLGHPVFASESRVLAIGYEYSRDGRILGVIYCPNRLSGLWELTVPKVSPHDAGDGTRCSGTRLTQNSRSCRSPRVLHRKGLSDLLIWVSNAVGGPHASCATLHVKDLETGEERILVEPVWDPQQSDFPGLYITTLAPYPFIQLSSSSSSEALYYLATSSIWRSRSTVVLISLQDGEVVELTPDDETLHYSWTVLCTDGRNKIVCTRSAPCRPPELVVGTIEGPDKVEWQVIAQPDLSDDLQSKLDTLSTSIIPIPDHHPTEIILLRSGGAASAPCITLPHGGPHSTMTTAFNAWTSTFALEGYTIAMPNYTGSLGFGEKYVRELLGRIGSLDVEDCMASVRHVVACGISSYGQGQQLLYGGSHGGFLLGHLIGQYPDVFSGAVLRNPVISLGEISTSDIPDWYYEESGLSFAATSVVTPEVYDRLFKMSPSAHVDAVRVPVIILIGEKDQRVAPTQGRNYYHALKARGKDVQLFCLKDDSHPLDSVEGQLVSYETARVLFDAQRSKSA
ncbi:hypothetical protein NM688_g6689 [Phlebia brevispora]|uniref:Uncharacterized protein n=1 Tax=Phlebia brevispora TaxID=194682 RepID=A0ACC1SDK6_9APHY|nr:hypothetical protein NM688_g6689 [Phlebia brevispora]